MQSIQNIQNIQPAGNYIFYLNLLGGAAFKSVETFAKLKMYEKYVEGEGSCSLWNFLCINT